MLDCAMLALKPCRSCGLPHHPALGCQARSSQDKRDPFHFLRQSAKASKLSPPVADRGPGNNQCSLFVPVADRGPGNNQGSHFVPGGDRRLRKKQGSHFVAAKVTVVSPFTLKVKTPDGKTRRVRTRFLKDGKSLYNISAPSQSAIIPERHAPEGHHARVLNHTGAVVRPNATESQGFGLGRFDTAAITGSNICNFGNVGVELPAGPPPPPPRSTATVSHAYVEAAKATLDEAVGMEAASSPDFRNRLFSLAPLKMFLSKRLSSSCFSPQSVPVVTDHLQRLVALHGFSMFRLRQLFEQSDVMLTQSLVATLRPRPELVPPGLTAEDVAEHVTTFFLSQPGRA
jgi:hypothetical protein